MLDNFKRDPGRFRGPEGQVLLAEQCLEVGMPDEAMKILDALAAADPKAKEQYKASTKAAVEAYAQVAPVINANVERADKATAWKDRLGYPAVTVDKHFALVHQENARTAPTAG